MTKLLIKQRVLNYINIYDIFGTKDEPKYFVKADSFTVGHKIHIYDYWTRKEIGVVHEKAISWMGKAEITVGGKLVGTVTRKFSFLHSKYIIDYNGWNIAGNYRVWDYTIVDGNGTQIAKIDKELANPGDTYVLTIDDECNEKGVLIMALAIDMFNNGQI